MPPAPPMEAMPVQPQQREVLPPPPVALSNTPAEVSGIPQFAAGVPTPSPAVDVYAATAERLVDNNPNYSRATALTKELDDRVHQSDAPGRLTMNKLEREAVALLNQYSNLDNQEPGSPYGADGGLMTRMLTLGSRKRYANQEAQRKSLAGHSDALRLANQLIESGDKRLLETIAKYQALGGDWKDLFKTVGTMEDKSIDNARQAESLKLREELGDKNYDLRMENLRLKQDMQPHQIARIDAGTRSATANAVGREATNQYAGQNAAALLNLRNKQAAAIDPNTAAKMAQATGYAPTPEMAQQSHVVAPPVAPGATAPLETPAFKLKREQAEATLEGKKAATEKTRVETAAKSVDLIRKATRAAKAGVGADYWEKRSDLWDALPREEKMKLLQKYASEK